MKEKTAHAYFEVLLRAARDVCEANAAYALAQESGKLDSASAATFLAQIYALEVRLEWLKGRAHSRNPRLTPDNIIWLPRSTFGRRTAR